jgi:hypothetical protein
MCCDTIEAVNANRCFIIAVCPLAWQEHVAGGGGEEIVPLFHFPENAARGGGN